MTTPREDPVGRRIVRGAVVLVRALALAVALHALVARAHCALSGTCSGSNLFSYFTIHSVVMVILTVLAALLLTALGRSEPAWLTVARALATTYMLVSGFVFALLLFNASLFDYLFLVPLSSKVLHFVLPLYAALDFLLAPGRNRLRWSTLWICLVFPVAWAGYTFVRGQLVGWYPYFFLDPHLVGGWNAVAFYACMVCGLLLLVAATVTAVTRLPRVPG